MASVNSDNAGQLLKDSETRMLDLRQAIGMAMSQATDDKHFSTALAALQAVSNQAQTDRDLFEKILAALSQRRAELQAKMMEYQARSSQNQQQINHIRAETNQVENDLQQLERAMSERLQNGSPLDWMTNFGPLAGAIEGAKREEDFRSKREMLNELQQRRMLAEREIQQAMSEAQQMDREREMVERQLGQAVEAKGMCESVDREARSGIERLQSAHQRRGSLQEHANAIAA